MTNQDILSALALFASTCTYHPGRGVFFAQEGEVLPEIPEGISVVVVKGSPELARTDPRRPADIGATRFACIQLSIATQQWIAENLESQWDRNADGPTRVRHFFNGICNINHCELQLGV